MGAAVVIVGHGLVERQVLGPVAFRGPPEALTLRLRRYRCRACRAVLVVGPRGLLRGRWYSGPAIAGALGAFARGATSPAVRAQTRPWRHVGVAAVERWATLERWVEAARRGELFAVSGLGELGARLVAEHVTLVLAARGGHRPGMELGASAFAGAAMAA
jgi:hypothetical protein